MTDPKKAAGDNKLDITAMPIVPLGEIAAVFQFGAVKYGRLNFRDCSFQAERRVYINAALRHLFAYAEGEDYDQETGISHLSHAVAGLMILRDCEMRGQIHREITNERAGHSPDWLSKANKAVQLALANLKLRQSKGPNVVGSDGRLVKTEQPPQPAPTQADFDKFNAWLKKADEAADKELDPNDSFFDGY